MQEPQRAAWNASAEPRRRSASGAACRQVLQGMRMGLACVTLAPLRVAVLAALGALLTVGAVLVLMLDEMCCGCRCVIQSRVRRGRGGRAERAQCRCRAAGSDRLHAGVPKRVYLLLCKPLLRAALFVCGFYCVHDLPLSGYRYDARACVVASAAGPIELMYWLCNFPGTPVLDMAALSVVLLPAASALGVLDASSVESEPPESPRGRRANSSALAQYMCMMATHNETHAGIHFGLPRLNIFLSGRSNVDEDLLGGVFACGLPLQPIRVRRAQRGALSMLTSFSNTMESVLLPVFAPSREEVADPVAFRHNIAAALRAVGSPAKSGDKVGERQAAMEESWRVEDDEDSASDGTPSDDDSDDSDSDWRLESDELETDEELLEEEDLEWGAARSKRPRRPKRAGHGREANRARDARDRECAMLPSCLRWRPDTCGADCACPGMRSPSMPNIFGAPESSSEDDMPATHWGARILREEEQRHDKQSKTTGWGQWQRGRRKRKSQPDISSPRSPPSEDDGLEAAKARARRAAGGSGDSGSRASKAARKKAKRRARKARKARKKKDSVRVAQQAPALNGGGARGWLRLHKVGDFAGVVRWCVDCQLAEDTLLVGMPLTDYAAGIVAPTFCEMLGLDEADVIRQHDDDDCAKLDGGLKEAFRALSKSLHPDKQPGRDNAKATADFQLLKLAKETLAVERDRGRYLQKLGAFRRTAVRVPWSFSSQ